MKWNDPAFAPGRAWREHPLWQAEALAVLAHARIDLNGARLSGDGRLSAPAEARAVIVEHGARPDPDWPGVVHRWEDLRMAWLAQTGLGLDDRETSAACLIAPADHAAPYFDDLAQHLVWPVRDRDGQWLALTLDQDDALVTIEALEAHVRKGWSGMVLVRMARIGERLQMRPVTLFGVDDPVDLSLWQRPWRAQDRSDSRIEAWLGRLKSRRERHFSPIPRGGTDAALAQAWRHVLDRAEMGPTLALSQKAGLAVQAGRLESYGWPTLSHWMRQAYNPDGLLVVAYGLLVARQQRCQLPLLR